MLMKIIILMEKNVLEKNNMCCLFTATWFIVLKFGVNIQN